MSVVVDTDIEADVDDVGALSVLHALADRGEARVLAVTVDTSSPWGPAAVDAIDTYHGRPDIPIGQWKGASLDPVGSPNEYTRALAQEFPEDLSSGANTPDATSLLRQTLAGQPDHSVVVIGIGFLNNLASLLASPADGYSSLSGVDLVRLKVRALSVMGGYYPSGTDDFNWGYDRTSASRVIGSWPGRIIFNGLGADVGTGPRLASSTPVTDPARRAYALFPGASTARPSWDQISSLVAVRGDGSLFTEVTGTNTYDASSGRNDFIPSSGGQHSYLRQSAAPSDVATTIEDLMVQAPTSTAVSNGVYRVTAAHSGKVLDVDRCSSTGAVQQYTSLSNDCQRWRFTATSSGYYRIQSFSTGLSLGVSAASTGDAAVVVQEPAAARDSQLWALGPTSDGRFRIVNKNSGKGLDVAYASTADGAAIWQYHWLGGANQTWALGVS